MKNLGVSKRIYSGFTIVLFLMVIAAVRAWFGMSDVVSDAKEVIDGNTVRSEIIQKEVDHLKWATKVNDLLTNSEVNTLDVQTDPHKCGFGKWYYGEGRLEAERFVPELGDVLAILEEPHRRLHESAEHIGALYNNVDPKEGSFLREAKVAHLQWSHRLVDAVVNQNQSAMASIQIDPTQCGFGRWLYSDEIKERSKSDPHFAQVWRELDDHHAQLHAQAVAINSCMDADNWEDASTVFFNKVNPLAEYVLAGIDKLLKTHDASMDSIQRCMTIYSSTTRPALIQVQEGLGSAKAIIDEHMITDDVMLSSAQATRRDISLLNIIALVAGLITAFFLARMIVKSLQTVVEKLQRGSSQVAAAADQVSGASQVMAEGASEQAASLERTSAALLEMSATTKNNASSAKQASEDARNVQHLARKGGQGMKRLSNAIDKIKESSDESARIMKTIDEIAFQTNLLALNAAVEAARAGDAGKGFAVVAEEVRSLAQRSADASRDTSDLITQSLESSERGVQVLGEVSDMLDRINEGVDSVNQSLSSVDTASREQAQGVDEISQAVTELDRVTQSNAASAEETASASEELSASSIDVKHVVEKLVQLMEGGDTPKTEYHPVTTVSRTARQGTMTKVTNMDTSNSTVNSWEDSEAMNIDEIISLEEDDLIEIN